MTKCCRIFLAAPLPNCKKPLAVSKISEFRPLVDVEKFLESAKIRA